MAAPRAAIRAAEAFLPKGSLTQPRFNLLREIAIGSVLGLSAGMVWKVRPREAACGCVGRAPLRPRAWACRRVGCARRAAAARARQQRRERRALAPRQQAAALEPHERPSGSVHSPALGGCRPRGMPGNTGDPRRRRQAQEPATPAPAPALLRGSLLTHAPCSPQPPRQPPPSPPPRLLPRRTTGTRSAASRTSTRGWPRRRPRRRPRTTRRSATSLRRSRRSCWRKPRPVRGV